MSADYIKELKIAVINMDIPKLEELCTVHFESSNRDELIEAAAMVDEAIKLLTLERAKVFDNMQNVQKMKQYILQNKKVKLLSKEV